MTSANVTHIQNLYAAFGRGDVATLLAGLSPDVDWETVGRQSDFPTLGPRKGTRQVEEFFKLVAENEDFSDFTPRELHAAGDKVFALGSYALKVAKTGKPVASEWVHVFTLRDGKVTRFREHTDTAQFAEGYAAASAKTALPRRFVDEVCNGRKLAVADELFAADHRYHDPGSPWAGEGPAGIKDVIGVYHSGVKDARWDVHEITATGDTVVLRWTGSGTHTGELLGIAPTNRKVRVDGIWMFRIADGMIAESWNCWDTLGMLQQLGVVPQLGAKAA
jgi:ketosteroid isomerase-like protein